MAIPSTSIIQLLIGIIRFGPLSQISVGTLGDLPRHDTTPTLAYFHSIPFFSLLLG